MKRSDIRVALLTIEGTNCDRETYHACAQTGVSPEIIHLKQLLGTDVSAEEKRSLFDYQALLIPGGFSAGDYIRAGAIFAARIKSRLGDELTEFIREGRLVGGICNGFQVLVELGLLPAFDAPLRPEPDAALITNDSSRFECRPTLLKHESAGTCAFTALLPRNAVVMMPSAHAEGKFTLPKDQEAALLKRLIDNDQIVFRYCDENGDTAAGYPWCPNGSLDAIAGICNPGGTVFGMMPHPERAFHAWQHPEYARMRSRTEQAEQGDGRLIFESMAMHCEKTF